MGAARRWWPDYLFHFTDITNAVRILNDRELVSRATIKNRRQDFIDAASPSIIDNTDRQWQNYVRLYFRPRTPTQFANEGIRPPVSFQYGAHCPIPVYFLFQSTPILCRADSLFSDGNLAAGAEPMHSSDEFQSIPFNMVYHDTVLGEPEKRSVVYRRNAEVIVPDRLDLATLKLVVCRSDAEHQTLMSMLPPPVRKQWGNRITVRPGLRLFFKMWTFIETVQLSSEKIVFHFNRDSKTPGPFAAEVKVCDANTSRRGRWNEATANNLNRSLTLLLRDQFMNYTVDMTLDGHPVYRGRFQDKLLPF